MKQERAYSVEIISLSTWHSVQALEKDRKKSYIENFSREGGEVKNWMDATF